MCGERLLDHGRARSGKANDEDWLRDIRSHARTRQDIQARRREERPKTRDHIQRFGGEIALAAHLAQRALASLKGGERFRVPAHLVEQLAFLGPFGRSQAALAMPPLDLIEGRYSARVILASAMKHGAGQLHGSVTR